MNRVGLSQDMLDMANEVGITLERAYEGKKAIEDSLQTQQQFARVLDQETKELYEKAMKAIQQQNEEELARTLLLKRTDVQNKLKEILVRCTEEKKRIEQMNENIRVLEMKAMEVDSLLRRKVSLKTIQDSNNLNLSNDLGLSLPSEDPLLKKFKDLGID